MNAGTVRGGFGTDEVQMGFLRGALRLDNQQFAVSYGSACGDLWKAEQAHKDGIDPNRQSVLLYLYIKGMAL